MNRIVDNSGDKKYFIITPQLVWSLSRDPYDYTLWGVIKMVAGEQGECFLTTDDLATLSMMSTGKVSSCRKYLLQQGLLEGQIKRDPGYPQPVWHLSIPDLWKDNLEWREKRDSLKLRIKEKQEQRESLHQVKTTLEGEPSPGEEGPSPGEEGPSPGETKKNHKEDPEKRTIPPSDFSDLFPEQEQEQGQNPAPKLSKEERLESLREHLGSDPAALAVGAHQRRAHQILTSDVLGDRLVNIWYQFRDLDPISIPDEIREEDAESMLSISKQKGLRLSDGQILSVWETLLDSGGGYTWYHGAAWGDLNSNSLKEKFKQEALSLLSGSNGKTRVILGNEKKKKIVI